ncbi:hypothetical protein HC864_01060 [Candidatus Gracilibacteria bacterium]|nr:hypothetical protein [Candidatus Gracilibacteria bacterium]
MFRRYNDPERCLSTASGSITVNVQIKTCNQNDPAQRFQFKKIIQDEYQAWLIGRKYNGSQNFSTTNLGHAFLGVARIQTITNGSGSETSWTDLNTYSRWPNSNGPNVNHTTDYSQAQEFINTGKIGNLDIGLRMAKISKSKSDWIKQNHTITGCLNYSVLDFRPFDNCVCTEQAARLWDEITGENFSNQINGINIAPNNFVNLINQYNSAQGGILANNGQVIN